MYWYLGNYKNSVFEKYCLIPGNYGLGFKTGEPDEPKLNLNLEPDFIALI